MQIKPVVAQQAILRDVYHREFVAVFQHILVAYDGSDVSERAFRVAVELARAFKGRVRVVSVIAIPPAPLDALPVVIEDERTWVANKLAALVGSVLPTTCAVDSAVAFGAPASALLEQATLHDVDHIVIGRTGKGALQRLLLGSVSRDIASRANIGLTLVP
jgi:nucleotide-binding universal stress UspA family protein